MMLNSSDKLRVGNTAALCVTCMERPGKVLNKEGSFPATKIFAVVKAPGKKLKDEFRQESGRTEKKGLGTLGCALCSHNV